MKTNFLSIAVAMLMGVFSLAASGQQSALLKRYDMGDGSTIHAMSDNGKWAVAYGVSEATSLYSYPKYLDFTAQTMFDILSEKEANSGIECFVNDVTDDGNICVGCHDGRPAYWNKQTKAWTYLNLATGNIGGRVEAVTPDGKYAVGVCTNGGYDEVPVMWDVETGAIVNLPNVPKCDLSGGYQQMVRFTGISADARYIVGCVSYSYPADVMYFYYDREEKKWDAIAFDFTTFTNKFTVRDESVRTLDGICISPNGEWVAGVVYSVNDTRNPFRYHIPTKKFENFNAPEDTDKGCVMVDNQGTIYAATPAVNPSRSLYIRHGGYWYGIDEVLSQVYGIDFYKATGYDATGLAVGISTDCKTMAALAYISHENYQVTLPTTFAEACEQVNLLGTYAPSIHDGAAVQKISNLSITFARNVEVLGSAASVVLKDDAGNVVRSANKVAVNNTSARVLNIGFRTTTLEEGRTYTIEIPAGVVCVEGDATKTNQAITLRYKGWGDKAIEMQTVSPAEGSTLGHIDMTTSPVIFTFNADVAVKEGAKALLYCNDESTPSEELNIVAGTTVESYNMVMAYPTASLNLYKGNNYRIVIPAGALTDLAGYAQSAEAAVNYVGSYERTIVSDDTHVYIETFESGVTGMMLYDGDRLTPTAEMQAWNFAPGIPWIHAADDDYSNPCATSHSMYTPAGKSDDWMVTPRIYIPDAKCTLTFDAQSYRFTATDRLLVYIYETPELINELSAPIVAKIQADADLVVNEVLDPGLLENTLADDWQSFSIDLKQYAGKQIYVAFANQNTDGSAIFVGNVRISRSFDFQIALAGVPETVVAQAQQAVRGSLIVTNPTAAYSSAYVALLDAEGNVVDEVSAKSTISAQAPFEFAFAKPLQLTIGEQCAFSVKAILDNGASQQQLDYAIKNLAFKPTKRVVLEENTGMGCQNCPLGHLAIERLQQLYADRFIPIAYHTYTGDPLESGMTDYAQYFLGLTAAPTGRIQRGSIVSSPMVSYTEGGTTDYTFTSKTADAWLDLVAKEFTTDAEADLDLTALYDKAEGKLYANLTLTPAINMMGEDLAVLCVVTEDGLAGYQSNGFASATDADLGEWQKGGAMGKANVYPYEFNHVARALLPANAYNGQTGVFAAQLKAEQVYGKSLAFDLATDAPYVKEISNCALVCMLLDATTGAVVNVATAHFNEAPAGIAGVEDAEGAGKALATPEGIVLAAHGAVATVHDAQGRLVGKVSVDGSTLIPTSTTGLFIVTFEAASGAKHAVKVVR
ncbi:MAG: Omp28-related outer membrane protein [Bacteroidaceae bacterium]|nr:Omp28-related outer membrane protein [Bacteroidaceae bacterium]